MKEDKYFWEELKNHRPFLTKQQYRTIKGQAFKGNYDAARKGLNTVMKRRKQHR